VLEGTRVSVSAIAETYRRLADAGGIRQVGGRRFAPTPLLLDGQPVDDLEVRISRRVTRVGADGVLGLDCLGRFTDVHFHVPSLGLTLRYHSGGSRRRRVIATLRWSPAARMPRARY